MAQDPLLGYELMQRYRLDDFLGQGGMARVYRGWDERLERAIAVKLLHPYLSSPSFVNRFEREARAAAKISNPHVVAVHDQGTCDLSHMWGQNAQNSIFLVMEYMEGPDLRRELKRCGSFPLGVSLELIRHILEGCAAAHEQQLIHCDLKPENVLLTRPLPEFSLNFDPRVQAKVADFGLARLIDQDATQSHVMGTLAYAAPEIFTDTPYDSRADLYSVGIMLYEFITGTLPFSASTPAAHAFKHVYSPMPRAHDNLEWLPLEVDSFIGHLTAKDPLQRPQSARQALKELNALQENIDDSILLRRSPVIPTATHITSQATRILPENTASSTQKTQIFSSEDIPVGENTSPEHTEILSATPAPALSPKQTLTSTHTGNISATVTDMLTEPMTHTHHKENPSSHEAQKENKKRRRLAPFLAVIIALIVACGAGAGWYYTYGPARSVPLPQVAGLSLEEAENKLHDAGFKTQPHEEYSDDVEKGVVITTDPEGGKSVRINRVIEILLSAGIEQVQVPQFEGLSKDEAQNVAKESRVTLLFTTDYSDTVPADSVISQDTPAGSSVDHDSSISLTLSLGKKPIEISQLAGKKLEEIRGDLEKEGLSLDITEEFSDDVPEGAIISSDPESGTLYKGDRLGIVLSKGPELVEVPSVIGRTKDQAIKILEDAGFKVETSNALGTVSLGLVYSQNPRPGSAPKGSTITISIV